MTTSQKVHSFLMFQGNAEEAISFYVSTIPGSEQGAVQRFPTGKVMKGEAVIGGQAIFYNDSPIQHAFTFTPSHSFFLTCDSEDEIKDLYAKLLEGGSAMMPLNNYGFSRQFAWVSDRFGVSWQLNLP